MSENHPNRSDTTDPIGLNAAFEEWAVAFGLPQARNILALGESFDKELAMKLLLEQSFLEGAMRGARMASPFAQGAATTPTADTARTRTEAQ